MIKSTSVPEQPPPNAEIDSLAPVFRQEVEKLLVTMKTRGFDPEVFETRRSLERQKWLYGVGRTHSLDRKPVTWTMSSKHIDGIAVDIISRSRGWDWPEFFNALAEEAEKLGLRTLPNEGCHVEQ